LMLTIGAAAASYHWFEQPFLKLKTRFQYVRSMPV
jgi:peptidoglycan/LPS O-acetylase OafA/YrhL